MTNVAERNFNTFHFGDNVYQLANELIPQIAERLDFPLSQEPNSAELFDLVGKIGKNKVLRDNTEITAIDRDTQVGFVEQSGIQAPMNRSLIDPDERVDSLSVDAFVLTGGVANWQDRGGVLVRDFPLFKPVYFAVGQRLMDTATEVVNPNVIGLKDKLGRYPTEAEYAQLVVGSELLGSGEPVTLTVSSSTDGEEIARSFFEDNTELLDRSLAFARVANAGIQFATQMRKAAQLLDPSFDTSLNSPQVYILTDSLPVARNEEQESQPTKYQKAATAMRQIALSAKLLHDAAGGE